MQIANMSKDFFLLCVNTKAVLKELNRPRPHRQRPLDRPSAVTDGVTAKHDSSVVMG